MLGFLSFIGVVLVTGGWLLGISYVDYWVAQYRWAQQNTGQWPNPALVGLERLFRLPWNWSTWGFSGGVVFIVALFSALIGFWVLVLLTLVVTSVMVTIVMSDTQQMRHAPPLLHSPTMATTFLYGISGAYRGYRVSLSGYEGYGITIGRGASNILRLIDTSVSREHAHLRYARGCWFLQDRDSAGGTYVNGQRISAAQLNNGDRFQIGVSTFEFRAG